MSTRVILVRHGRSTYNELGLFQGNCDDSHLTDRGIVTAAQTGSYLSQFNIDLICTSPLIRAQQTTQIIANQLPKPIPAIVLDDLREIHLPAWQGLPYQLVRSESPHTYQIWQESPEKFKMPLTSNRQINRNFYPVRELFDRAHKVWQTIIPQYHDSTILIVSHGGTIQALIATALGLTPQVFQRIQQSNCGVSILTFSADLTVNARLESLNLTHHLGEQIPKLKAGKEGVRKLLQARDSSPDIAKLPPLDLPDLPNLHTEIQACSFASIHDTLQQIFGQNFSPQSCQIKPDTFCIIHQPIIVKHSIVQAINWAI